MAIKPIKSLLLKIALGMHNACTFIALNILMWRNNLWKKEKWTKPGREMPGARETQKIPTIPVTQETL
jgi:hypothetical protein